MSECPCPITAYFDTSTTTLRRPITIGEPGCGLRKILTKKRTPPFLLLMYRCCPANRLLARSWHALSGSPKEAVLEWNWHCGDLAASPQCWEPVFGKSPALSRFSSRRSRRHSHELPENQPRSQPLVKEWIWPDRCRSRLCPRWSY